MEKKKGIDLIKVVEILRLALYFLGGIVCIGKGQTEAGVGLMGLGALQATKDTARHKEIKGIKEVLKTKVNDSSGAKVN